MVGTPAGTSVSMTRRVVFALDNNTVLVAVMSVDEKSEQLQQLISIWNSNMFVEYLRM